MLLCDTHLYLLLHAADQRLTAATAPSMPSAAAVVADLRGRLEAKARPVPLMLTEAGLMGSSTASRRLLQKTVSISIKVRCAAGWLPALRMFTA
jgi:hypothetical protein